MVEGGPNLLGGAVGDGDADGPGVLVMLGFEVVFTEITSTRSFNGG